MFWLSLMSKVTFALAMPVKTCPKMCEKQRGIKINAEREPPTHVMTRKFVKFKKSINNHHNNSNQA